MYMYMKKPSEKGFPKNDIVSKDTSIQTYNVHKILDREKEPKRIRLKFNGPLFIMATQFTLIIFNFTF